VITVAVADSGAVPTVNTMKYAAMNVSEIGAAAACASSWRETNDPASANKVL
jgi:hypothetical protein